MHPHEIETLIDAVEFKIAFHRRQLERRVTSYALREDLGREISRLETVKLKLQQINNP